MAHIFFSYQYQNKEIAVKVHDALKFRGFATWIDMDDMEEKSALGSIAVTIENASVVIMCLSTEYQNSPYCRTETEYIIRLKKPVIPILVEAGFIRSGWLKLALDSQIEIDFSDPKKYDEKFRQLLRYLLELKD